MIQQAREKQSNYVLIFGVVSDIRTISLAPGATPFFFIGARIMSKKKDAIAFLHDANAKDDLKIVMLRQEFGLEGYGAYFMIVEILREQSNFKIDLSEIEGVNYKLKPHNIDFEKFLKFCFEKGLFKKDKKHMWSESLLRRMKAFTDARERMSQGGKKAMKKRYKHLTSTLQEPNKVNQSKYKEKETNTNQIENKAKEILDYLSQVTGRKYQDEECLAIVIENLSNGHTLDDHMQVINVKKYDQFFKDNPWCYHPSTIFGPKFSRYKTERIEDYKQKNTGPQGSRIFKSEEEERLYYEEGIMPEE